MISTVRNLIISVVTILLLSITISGKPVFTYIYEVISSVTIPAQRGTERLASDSIAAIRKLTLDLFDNSVPKVRDQVKSSLSSPARSIAPQKYSGEPQEHIERKDRQQLDALIKSHR
jgi:hypothetical protein